MDKYFFSNVGTYLNPPHPVSDELIAQLESERGFILPPSYIQLLKIQNGGYIRKNLFLYDEDQEATLDSLAGIGKDRNGGMDLLVPEENPLIAGEEFSKILPIDYNNYGYIALDYRSCGLKGSPGIIRLDVLEEPVFISNITGNYESLIKGLQRNESNYILGICADPEDPSEVVSRLQICLKAKVDMPTPGETPVYRFRIKTKMGGDFFELAPNINYATHYDGDKVLSRPAGLEFEEFPECNWLFKCFFDLSHGLPQLNKFLERIISSGIPLKLIHEPQPDMIAWVIRPKHSKND